MIYIDVEEAKAKERRALNLSDIDLELEASHQMIQGTGGRLLREPVGNAKYPSIVPQGFEESLRLAFQDEQLRRMVFGL